MTSVKAQVVGISSITGLGLSWRGLSERVKNAAVPNHRVALGAMPTDLPRQERMAERLMSRAAMLGHLAVRGAIAEAGWDQGDERSDLGVYMGVGASGGSTDQLHAILCASRENETFSLTRFGGEGLRACNPLYAFQLMNNFAMCHAAILSGLQGPNMALYSRGGGTVCALSEALFALRDPEEDCRRVLVGGTDCASDPVTTAELARQGYIAEGLVPGEGAAILALTTNETADALATVASCAFAPTREVGLKAAFANLVPSDPVDAVVICAWGPARMIELRTACHQLFGDVAILDVTRAAGETLAASPAVAWASAVDLVQTRCRRVLVLSCGVDDELGVVEFERAAQEAAA
jgi:hypothetical protein